MKLQRATLIFTLLGLTGSALVTAQETPKAELLDEFGSIPCEELLSRTDGFFAELSRNPNDVGYAIIYPGGRNASALKKIISGSVYMRRFDRTRLRIVMASDISGYLAGQLWRVPPGADPPRFTEVSEPPRDLSKPFVFGQDFDDNVCPTFIPDDYVELVKAHPGSLARVVISGRTWLSRKQQAEVDLEVFTHLGLSPNRIKFYFVHRPDSVLTEVTYWFVPAREKQ